MESQDGVITDDPLTELRWTAGSLAVAVAAIHLFHPSYGVLRLIEFIRLGTMFNPLPPLFTLAAFLIVFGIVAVYFGVFVRTVYLLGIVLMCTFVLGYIAWHTVLEHGAFWPYIDTHGHGETNPIVLLIGHARNDAIGLVSKLLELVLVAVLAVLYRIDQPG